jgi:hypothetical protein
VSRSLNITDGTPGPGGKPFAFDNTPFVFSNINKTVNINNIEQWTITNNNVFGHAFHIHDVEFKIVARNGSAANVGAFESGWKDVVYVPVNESVSFVAKFDDYADLTHPFMYHCHFGLHEDDGMMGQFVVSPFASGVNTLNWNTDFTLYPNPANNHLYVTLSNNDVQVYYISITTPTGRTVMMLPQPDIKEGIDISYLPAGTYILQLTDRQTKSITTRQFVKQ